MEQLTLVGEDMRWAVELSTAHLTGKTGYTYICTLGHQRIFLLRGDIWAETWIKVDSNLHGCLLSTWQDHTDVKEEDLIQSHLVSSSEQRIGGEAGAFSILMSSPPTIPGAEMVRKLPLLTSYLYWQQCLACIPFIEQLQRIPITALHPRSTVCDLGHSEIL